MPIKKIDIANEALYITGLVSASNPATPEMTSAALKAMERAILGLERDGVYLSYNKSENMFRPDGNQDSGLSDSVVDDVIKYISIDICEALAAPFTGEMKIQKSQARRDLMPTNVLPIKRVDNIPSGAGNQRGCYRDYDNYLPSQDGIDVTDDGFITIED